jgi:hypothetical protein
VNAPGTRRLIPDVVHRMDMDFQVIILGILWLVGGNVLILMSLKRQNLSLKHMLTPNVVTKLQAQDWLKILALLIVTMAIAILLQ